MTATARIVKKSEAIQATALYFYGYKVNLAVEGGCRIFCSYVPETTEAKDITWTSSDEQVARVDAGGNISAVEVGTATITGTLANGVSNSCKVNVYGNSEELNIDAESLSFASPTYTVAAGEYTQAVLEQQPQPQTGFGQLCEFESSDETVATVDANGVVKALQPGTATITAKMFYPDISTTCTVVVTKPATKPSTSTPTANKAKKTNPMKLTPKKVKVKAKTLAKKSVKRTRAKYLKVSKAKGTKTFKRGKISCKKKLLKQAKSKIKISKKGKLTLKKGLKKGTYKVRVKVRAAGTTSYKAATKTITITIRVTK